MVSRITRVRRLIQRRHNARRHRLSTAKHRPEDSFKHTIFYDALPHYFLEFDVLDRATGAFLSTAKRQALLAGLPVVSVPVIWEGRAPTRKQLEQLVGPSLFKSVAWRERLDEIARERDLDVLRVRSETDSSNTMEGLYVKLENQDAVIDRFKFIGSTFRTSVVESASHWLTRPIVPNQMKQGVDLFSGTAPRKT